MTDLGALLQGLLHFSVFLLYCLAGGLYFRWLMPLLNVKANRLAVFMLLAQIVLVGLAYFHQPASDFDRWLWDLDGEYNMFSTLAAAQFALVGSFAILTGWMASACLAWQRLYFAGIGLLFVILTYDEYHGLRAIGSGWQLQYAALGVGVAIATALIARRSPPNMRKWYICFLTGLALSSAGALFLDEVPCSQGALGPWRIDADGCLIIKPVEEILESLGIWLALVAMLGLFSNMTPRLKRALPRRLSLLALALILLLLLPFLSTAVELRLWSRQTNVRFESKIIIEAFRLQNDEDSLAVALFLSSGNWHNYSGLGYSIHLVDQVSGKSAAHVDKNISRRYTWKTTLYEPRLKYLQRSLVAIPPDAPKNRAMWIVLTHWRQDKGSGKFINQKALASDLQLLSDAQVILGEYVIRSDAEPSPAAPLVTFDNGFALQGIELPERSQIGENLRVMFSWRSDADGLEDYIQFLHFGREEGDEWWGYDQQPLGPRLPTRLWYNGLSDSEVWQVPLPADLAPGQYSVYTGLYRSRDQQRVIAETFPDSRVPLGSLLVEA